MQFTQTIAAIAALSASAYAQNNRQFEGNNFGGNFGTRPTQTANVKAENKAAQGFPTSINFGNFGGQNGQRPSIPAGNIPSNIPKVIPSAFQGGRPSAAPAAPARQGGCPAIWTQISKDLTAKFSDNGQCNDLARAAIRMAFHDCGAWDQSHGTNAGCDGSLYLAKEYTRSENSGMQDTIPQIGAMAAQYGVGVADFFQFAAGKSFTPSEYIGSG